MKVLIRDHIEPNIFELFIAFLCIVSGIGILFNDTTALHRELDYWVVVLWAVSLIYSGVVITLGIVLTRVRTELGTNIHKSGLIPLTVSTFVYSAAILMSVGTRGLLTATIVTMFGLSCIAKLRVLYRRTKTMHIVSKAGSQNERI